MVWVLGSQKGAGQVAFTVTTTSTRDCRLACPIWAVTPLAAAPTGSSAAVPKARAALRNRNPRRISSTLLVFRRLSERQFDAESSVPEGGCALSADSQISALGSLPTKRVLPGVDQLCRRDRRPSGARYLVSWQPP